jgi:hypothetical protein
MKLCLGIWCPSTIFWATLSFLFLLCFGSLLIFVSLDWFFAIQIHDRWPDTIPGDVTSIKADHIDKSNEGKLVYVTGDTTTDISTDPLFGLVVSNVLQLRRVVEKFEGQNKGWSNTASPLKNNTFMPKSVKLGAFTLSSGLVNNMRHADNMPHSQWLPMTKELFEQIPDNLSVQLGDKLHLNNGNYYVGQEPAKPQFGDLRLRFFVINVETVSVIAKQVGSDLVSYRTQSGHDIELLKSGVASMEEVISTHSKKILPVKTYYFFQFYQRLIFYLLGFFTLSFGIYLIFLTLKLLNNFPPAWTLTKLSLGAFIGIFVILLFITYGAIIVYLAILHGIYAILLPLSKLIKNIPFFDSITNRFNWLSALIISISLFLIIIASIWISYLPMLGVVLIIMALGNLYFLKPAHRLLTVPNFEPPELPLVQETVVPQKGYSMPLG